MANLAENAGNRSSRAPQVRPLTIFVHRASECLTDYEMHGDGLICFSVLNGLAERGHTIYAFTDRAAIHDQHPRLSVKAVRSNVPIHSLAAWQQSLRAEQWFARLSKTENIDVVWRMHPYGVLPHRVPTLGKPLVIGPMFYSWPTSSTAALDEGRPRFGISLTPIVMPFLRRGWRRTMRKAALILCATAPHVEEVQKEVPTAEVEELPVIVEPPVGLTLRGGHFDGSRPLRLIFVGQLRAHKNPLHFCEIICQLHRAGVSVEGCVVGEGEERVAMEMKSRAEDTRIEFLGKLPNREVWAKVQHADLLVSLSVGEPYGRGIAEAMAVGTPAVCHRSGGPADFISHSVDGILVQNLDATDFTSAIMNAVGRSGELQSLSANAIRKASSWRKEVVLDRLEALLLRTI